MQVSTEKCGGLAASRLSRDRFEGERAVGCLIAVGAVEAEAEIIKHAGETEGGIGRTLRGLDEMTRPCELIRLQTGYPSDYGSHPAPLHDSSGDCANGYFNGPPGNQQGVFRREQDWDGRDAGTRVHEEVDGFPATDTIANLYPEHTPPTRCNRTGDVHFLERNLEHESTPETEHPNVYILPLLNGNAAQELVYLDLSSRQDLNPFACFSVGNLLPIEVVFQC